MNTLLMFGHGDTSDIVRKIKNIYYNDDPQEIYLVSPEMEMMDKGVLVTHMIFEKRYRLSGAIKSISIAIMENEKDIRIHAVLGIGQANPQYAYTSIANYDLLDKLRNCLLEERFSTVKGEGINV